MTRRTPPAQFVTERLLLHAARAEHAASIFRVYTGNEQASLFLPRGPHPSQSRTEAVIAAWGETRWADSDRFVWTIMERASDQPIGLFLLFLDSDGAEIHYGLGPEFWGKGFATEAGLAVMHWVREVSRLSHVQTLCAAGHNQSCRVLEKIGLVQDSFAPQALLMNATGEKRDGWLYIWRRMHGADVSGNR